jgi:DNA-binding transcriptional regulator YiaG
MSRPASTEDTVVSLSARTRYRADFQGLASAQVRAAREKLDMDCEDFAGYLSGILGWPVMAGVVARWEDGEGTPPGDVVLAASTVTRDVQAAAAALGYDSSEGGRFYPSRGLIGRETWNGIIRGAREHLWLYGMAEHGYADDDQVPAIIEEAAAAGCEVRVLLLDPGYPGITDIDAAEGKPAGTLAARILASMASFAETRRRCGGRMGLRAYNIHPTISVVRGDGEMLVTPYMWSMAGNNSPTLEITAASKPEMFDRFARGFTSMWELARECA